MSSRLHALGRLGALLGLAALPLLGAAGCGTTAADGPYYDDVSYLSAWGEWIHLPPYGLVWQPYSRLGWSPYSRGEWVWTPDGWAWASPEPFGWLVNHYGDWGYRPGLGWFWVRSDRWARAPAVRWNDLPERERRRLRQRIPEDVASRDPPSPQPTPPPARPGPAPPPRVRERGADSPRTEPPVPPPQVERPARPERRDLVRPERPDRRRSGG